MASPPTPLIGVTTYRQETSWWAWERDAALVPGAYLDVVEAAGGQPLLVAPPGVADAGGDGGAGDDGDDGDDRWRRVVAALDGLVLIGGGDIDAARYGQVADARNGGTNSRRDEMELSLVEAALGRGLPVLAVCRGMQVLNVALGGDLTQQLPDLLGTVHHQPRAGAFGAVEVVTAPESKVRQLLGERIEVLCCHHQALATVARDLVPTATSDDDVIEAVELAGHDFVVGVQWHPEETGDTRLFSALVQAARQFAAGGRTADVGAR